MRGRRCTPPAPAIRPTLGQREHRILGGDDDVAGQRDLEPAPHRDAVHRGDQRLVEVEAMRKAGKAGARPRATLARRLHLQIVAGREGALTRTSHDADPQIVACRELVPDLFQFVMRLAVQRVHHLRPVQRDDAQPALVDHGAVAIVTHATTLRR
jgi:hypothetical protein